MPNATSPIKLLVVDDDRWLAESMAAWLSSEGLVAEWAADSRSAVNRLRRQRYDLAIVDVRLGGESGLDLIAAIIKEHPDTAVLAMSGYATPDLAAECNDLGTADLLSKPIIDRELLLAIDKAVQSHRVAAEVQQLRAEAQRRQGLDDILSRDSRMQRIFEVIDAVADTTASVLITGENGTGKSMIARAIHRRSSRRNRPFVEVACGALPDNLLESELFGHVAGAFTGATHNKPGKFTAADGGTLFLDEIGTASPALQVKLLRVLQEMQFEPLGGNQTCTVDARIVLATNEDLSAAVARGDFRQDLYYRINVIHVELPPLRERPDDLPLLIDHFLRTAAATHGRDVQQVSPEAMDVLLRHSWPGNIRELENLIERLVLLARGPVIGIDAIPSQILSSRSAESFGGAPTGGTGHDKAHLAREVLQHRAADRHNIRPLAEALADPERQIILEALRLCEGNRSEAANALQIDRTTLYKKMRKLAITE